MTNDSDDLYSDLRSKYPNVSIDLINELWREISIKLGREGKIIDNHQQEVLNFFEEKLLDINHG